MRRVVEFFFVLAVVGFQVALWPDLTQRVMPAFLLALAFAWGFADNRLAGFRLAFASGLALDLYAQHHFGMFTIALSAAYGLVFVVARDEEQGLGSQLATVIVGATAYELVILTFLQLSDSRFPFFANLTGVATLNAAGTVVAFLGFSALVSAYYVRSTERYAKRIA